MKLIKYFSILLLFGVGLAQADQVFYTTEQFLQRAFPQGSPSSNVVWLTDQHKQRGKELLGHAPAGLRLRYWVQEGRSAWVVDEIGKEHPITIGVVIEQNQIQMVEILVFRESRGGEVRYDFFKKQFVGAQLNEEDRLNKNIDGISGATLSVNAVTAVARWVLYLHGQVAA